MRLRIAAVLAVWVSTSVLSPLRAEPGPLVLSRADYEDRLHGIWLGQILGVLMTLPFEHKVSAVAPVTKLPKPYTFAIVDDDWYYEMVAVRGFEQHGTGLTIEQLGTLWKSHNCGTWGSSKYAREALLRGVPAADAGHPRHNRLWHTIGPLFSCELYGALAPGNPNLAGKLTRDLGRINGHGEGLDGGIFAAGLVSVAFRERDPQEVVRQAARLIDPSSPMREAIDDVIRRAEAGRGFAEIANAVEDRRHIEYPATNNAVSNGGLLAACVWFGKGDFRTSIDLAARAGDFVDADNIAAVAAAVSAAMHGTKTLPPDLVKQLSDRIAGDRMGHLVLTPAVDEKISDLARRTADVGAKMLAAHGATVTDATLTIPYQEVVALPPQRFVLADLMQHFNPDWTLERAGFGGGDGGLPGIRGGTFLEGDILATYPRDEVRGLVLHRTLTPVAGMRLRFLAGVDPGRAWNLDVYVDDKPVQAKCVEAPAGIKARHWETIDVDLTPHAGKEIRIRLFQRVLVDGKTAGNAYWKDLETK